MVDEVGSDTSGDTGTSDSGRGGSEDDVNIEQILHGDRERSASSTQPVTSPHQPAVDNERYTRFPPARGPRGDPHKPHHVRFDTLPPSTRPDHPSFSPSSTTTTIMHTPRSRPTTPSHEPPPTNQRTVSFSPTVRSSPGPSSIFLPKTPGREGSSFSSSAYKDVSFTPLPQHSPQRTLSTFGSPGRPAASFSTFHKARTASQQSATSADDDASTTTSGSYTLNPDEFRMDGYVGSDVIV
ncbi:hypothetical protein ACOMHN_032384 [Nucella lapillus]